MSDITKSMIRGWNNDGMEPDWKPQPKPKPGIISDIEELIRCSEFFAGFMEDHKEDSLKDIIVNVTFHGSKIVELREILDKIKGKDE